MVVIITGATHTGKTRLAQKLLEKYKYPYLSIDHLKMGLIRSKNTNLTPDDDKELTLYLWPIVKEMIKTSIENKQNLIVEGCYIPFNWQEDFNKEYIENIKFICLCFSNTYIDNYFDDIKKYSSSIESRIFDDYCTKENLKRDNQLYFNGFTKEKLDVVLIDDSYDEVINNKIILYGVDINE